MKCGQRDFLLDFICTISCMHSPVSVVLSKWLGVLLRSQIYEIDYSSRKNLHRNFSYEKILYHSFFMSEYWKE